MGAMELDAGGYFDYSGGSMKKKNKKPAAKKPLAKASPGSRANVMPLADRVLVKPLDQKEDTTTSFGIIIPDTVSKEKPETGIVVAVGPGKKNDEGRLVPVGVKVGDKVLFSKYGFDEIKVGGVEYYMLSENNILAIIK